jgi:hypothetical protein
VRRPGVVERRIVRARQTQRNFRLLLRFDCQMETRKRREWSADCGRTALRDSANIWPHRNITTRSQPIGMQQAKFLGSKAMGKVGPRLYHREPDRAPSLPPSGRGPSLQGES